MVAFPIFTSSFYHNCDHDRHRVSGGSGFCHYHLQCMVHAFPIPFSNFLTVFYLLVLSLVLFTLNLRACLNSFPPHVIFAFSFHLCLCYFIFVIKFFLHLVGCKSLDFHSVSPHIYFLPCKNFVCQDCILLLIFAVIILSQCHRMKQWQLLFVIVLFIMPLPVC